MLAEISGKTEEIAFHLSSFFQMAVVTLFGTLDQGEGEPPGKLERAGKPDGKGTLRMWILKKNETRGNVENKNPMNTKKTLYVLLT